MFGLWKNFKFKIVWIWKMCKEKKQIMKMFGFQKYWQAILKFMNIFQIREQFFVNFYEIQYISNLRFFSKLMTIFYIFLKKSWIKQCIEIWKKNSPIKKIVYSFEFGKDVHGFKFMFMHCKNLYKIWKWKLI